MSEKIYKRNCPECNEELTTKNKYWNKKAIEENKLCIVCNNRKNAKSAERNEKISKSKKEWHSDNDITGENNPFYGKSHSKTTKKILSKKQKERFKSQKERDEISKSMIEYHKEHENSFKGKSHTKETKEYLKKCAIKRWENDDYREKMTKILKKNQCKGIDNPFYGNVHSDESKEKMSKSQLNRFKNPENHPFYGKSHSEETKEKLRKINKERCKLLGLPFHPSYNPNSIPIIEEYGKENGYEFQHAENGGEYKVRNNEFYVDGYDKENNVVIEYYEKRHYNEHQRYLDEWRREKIINELNCKFVEINYKGDLKIYEN